MNRTPEYTPWAITLLSGVVILGSILGCGLLDDSEEDDGPRCDSWNAQYIRVDGDVNLSIEAMEESVKEGSEGEEDTENDAGIPDSSEWLVGVFQGSGNELFIKGCVRRPSEYEDEDGDIAEVHWEEWQFYSTWQFRGPVHEPTKLWAGKLIPGTPSMIITVRQFALGEQGCNSDPCQGARVQDLEFHTSGVSRAEVEDYNIDILRANGWVLDGREEERLDFDFDISWQRPVGNIGTEATDDDTSSETSSFLLDTSEASHLPIE